MYEAECENDLVYQTNLTYPVVNLMAAVFRLTAQDLKYGNDQIHKEAVDFLDSGWFMVICDSLNLEAIEVRRLIENGNPRNRRSYEE